MEETLPETVQLKERKSLEGLNQLRAFAITYVFFYHYRNWGHPDWLTPVASFGWTGVDLFFVLSGFLISSELFIQVAGGKQIGIKTFFLKRFFRIIPPYLVVLFLYFTFPFVREGQHMGNIWRYLTFTLNFGLDWRHVGVFSHSWSLCVEEQFYLLLPLTILLFTRFHAGGKAAYLVIALFLLALILRAWEWTHFIQPMQADKELGTYWHIFIYYPTYNRLDGLLAGVSIAGAFIFYPKTKEFVSRHSIIFLVTGVVACIAAWYICQDGTSELATVAGFPLVSAGYGMIVAAVVCPGYFGFKFSSVVVNWLASLSYAIYLVHKMTIHITQLELTKLGIDKNSNLMFGLCILTAITGAILMRFLIERPAMLIRNRILAGPKE